MLHPRQLDHLVYGVHDLEAANINFYNATGIRPILGGRHLSKGTHNSIVNLGNKSYLEFIAIDHNNLNIQPPRWMGIDLINEPQLLRWAIKSHDLENEKLILENYYKKQQTIVKGNRITRTGETLQWQMIEPYATPKVELMPFLIDWSKSNAQPTDKLAQEAELLELIFYHPEPVYFQPFYDLLFDSVKVTHGKTVKITATIQGPKGQITI